MPKERADTLLLAQNLCDSREQSKRLILAGEVFVGTHRVSKPSTKLDAATVLSVKNKPKYVSRGGLKLEGALDYFQLDPKGLVCLDCGASTGGFTDCLLQRGAAKVHAIDVGTNQLVWKLRSDPRVIVKEKFNARYMSAEDIGGELCQLAVTDVSFISLTKILPALYRILAPEGHIICLIKPQFELEREDIGKGGIVTDPGLHEKAVQKIQEFVIDELGRTWLGHTDSPIKGAEGNKEFLALLK